MNVCGVFLPDALQDAFGAGTLDLAGDTRIFGLERLADLLRQFEVDGGVPDNFAFLLHPFNHRRVTGLAGGAADSTLVENAAPAVSALAPTSTSRREIFEPFINVSSIPSSCWFAPRSHYLFNARQRSGGKCTQTVLPCGMFSPAEVSTRS